MAPEKGLAFARGFGDTIPLPRSLHPHLDWWLDKVNILQGQPLHPLCHGLQLFTDASN